eukprot:m51a1_g8471 putative replication protein a 70 kda dna-binding subunit (646) ;mRNA; f:485091-487370
MSVPPLTSGAIARMNQPGDRVQGPILQVIDVKSITAAVPSPNANDRYRLLVSDGVHLQQAMLGSQLNQVVKSGQVVTGTVIRVEEYTVSVVKDRKVFIITTLKPLGNIAKIGSPVAFDPNSARPAAPAVQPSAPATTAPVQYYRAPAATAPPPGAAVPPSRYAAPAMQQQQRGPAAPAAQGPVEDLSTQPLHPVRTLSPYQNRWVIKVRVTSKSAVREFHNARGEGKVFSVDLIDQHGTEIRASAFSESVDRFNALLVPGQCYYISRCVTKLANKRFTTIAHEYELTMGSSSVVQPAPEDPSIPRAHFSFVDIASLAARPKDDNVDVIGVVTEVGQVSRFVPRNGGNELSKRTVTLGDSTSHTIEVTLWGEKAEACELPLGTVLAIRGCKVSDFNTKSLSTVVSSVVDPSPDVPEAARLRGWFEATGGNVQWYAISQRGNFGGAGGQARTQHAAAFKTFGEAQLEQVSAEDGYFFDSVSAVTLFRVDGKFSYSACGSAAAPAMGAAPGARPGRERACQAKVTFENGMYYCAHCNKSSPTCNERYILNFSASDHTGSQWMTAFHEAAIKMLGGVEAAALLAMDEAQRARVFYDGQYRWYQMRVKCKTEMYRDEARPRYTVVSIDPLNYVAESTRLVELIEKYPLPN